MGLHSEPTLGDAFGAALLAEMAGSPYERHYIERSDGYMNDLSHSMYFLDEEEWPEVDRAILERLNGRVLDVGAGAGRASLAAQNRGLDVTALDVSPGAIEVCRARGVEKTFLGTLEDLLETGESGSFDTFVFLGNNIGYWADRSGRH